MKSKRAIVVLDDGETISNAVARGVSLSELLKRPCVQCGKDLLLTQAQHNTYLRDAGNKALAFQCGACYVAQIKREQSRGARD